MRVAWDDLHTVLQLVRHGSLAGAAAELDVNYTTIARRVRRAEEALGQPLFDRLADGYRANDAARLVAEHAAQMERSQHDLLRQLAGLDDRLSGPLIITAPQLLISSFLLPMLDAFGEAHPRIDLSVRASNDLLDLSRREADLAIRVSNSPGDTLKGRRLCAQHSASFATQDWAERIADDPHTMIDWLLFAGYQTIPENIPAEFPNHRVRLSLDDMVPLLAAAQAGLGVARLPMFLGRTSPGLVQVPVLPPQPYPEIWAVAHADVWPSAKVKAFTDMLIAQFRQQGHLFVA